MVYLKDYSSLRTKVCVLYVRFHIKIIPFSPPSTFIRPYCRTDTVNSRGHKVTYLKTV